jgi:hypothetical protein
VQPSGATLEPNREGKLRMSGKRGAARKPPMPA